MPWNYPGMRAAMSRRSLVPPADQSHDLDDPKCPHCGKRLLE